MNIKKIIGGIIPSSVKVLGETRHSLEAIAGTTFALKKEALEKIRMFKIDLHSHSTISKDGGISLKEYRKLLESGAVDYIAVTDHDLTEEAFTIQKELGDRIIVGEEIKTSQGEVIGLFLKEWIASGQPMDVTIELIHAQGAIAYVPHPFDPRRARKLQAVLDSVIDRIDIVEVFNPRTLSVIANRKAREYARKLGKPYAASSDSHSRFEVGRTYTLVSEPPTAENLVSLLQKPQIVTRQALPHHYFNPVLNIARKKLKKLWR